MEILQLKNKKTGKYYPYVKVINNKLRIGRKIFTLDNILETHDIIGTLFTEPEKEVKYIKDTKNF